MKYVIIGGVAGGASAAARLRRIDEHAEIIVLEKGAHVSYANCGLPYYIGDVIKERDKLLLQTPVSFKNRFNIDVRVQHEAIGIDRDKKEVSVTNLVTKEVYTEHYDKLLLSPGANPFKPNISGIDLPGIFTLRNVVDTDTIKSYTQQLKSKKAVIVGAGFIGLEMAENLHHLGFEVHIIEMINQILAPIDFEMAALAQQHLREKGVHLHLSTTVTGFEKINEQLKVVLNNTGPLIADIVILSIGVKSDTKLAAAAGLELGKSGSIKVNEYLQTSDENIFAVGDAIEFHNQIINASMPTYLAGPANKQGRIVADNMVLGNRFKYNGSINTAIVKLFDITVATAGMASKHLDKFGISHQTVVTHSGSHAGYYPDAHQMSIQLSFDPQTKKVLGAQIVGKEGVDKRIDILSSVIQRGSTIDELMEFEHAYAPPFSSAKDPVNMIGFVADNLLTGKLRTTSWKKAQELDVDDVLIDVRTPEEFALGHIPLAVNMPIDTLREHMHLIPKDKHLYIYCQIGLRGYLAQRILLQNGYDCIKNLSGGYKTWEASINA
jgi:NADPH-dependent 2,4-dienoyl-CoA reductase/sulfur reductase-like enzyme/rhodanese-related sulfurtransferase